MPRSLLPREHGAYVQLAAPLLAAIAAFGATFASTLLAIAACAAFLANEPLLVVLGHRGKRATAENGARAKRRLAMLASIAVTAGLGGLVLAPRVLEVAPLVAVPALVLVGFAWRRKERTLAGELVAAVALTGAAALVAVAAGASFVTALTAWLAWAIGYGFTVVAVHRVIARHRRPPSWIDAATIAGALALAVALVAAQLFVALPLAAGSIILMLVAPSAAHLRTVGFVFVGLSLISSALLVLSL